MEKREPQKPTKSETDGMTVDWIVLTASTIGLAIVALASIQAGENGLAANLGAYVNTHYFF